MAFVLLALAFVYGPSVRDNGFVNWDDDVHLLENPFTEDLGPRSLGPIFTTTVNGTYIPLSTLSFAVERKLSGLNPAVYRLNNLLLHAGVCLLILILARQAGISWTGAACAALVFGVHPMHVESVAWVTGRKDVLYSFFALLALYCYGRYAAVGQFEFQRERYYAMVLLFLLLAVLAKPMALGMVFVFILYDWYLKRPWSPGLLWEKIPFLLVAAPVAGVTYAMQARLPELKFPDSLLTWVWCFAFYLRKFFYPDAFVVFYGLPKPLAVTNLTYLASVTAFVLFIAGIFVFRKCRMFVLACLFYIVSIFFLLRFDAAADANVVADRFMYLPSLGFCLLLGYGAQRLLEKYGKNVFARGALIAFLLAAVTGLGAKAYYQTLVWKDSVSLWGHQMDIRNDVATALIYQKLGDGYLRQPDFQKILDHYVAIKERPLNTLDYNDRLLLENDIHKIGMVMQYFQAAIAIKPDFENAFYGMGDLYYRLGNGPLAFQNLARAIELRKDHFDAYFLLAKVNQAAGLHAEAVLAFRKAVELYPEHGRMLKKVLPELERMSADAGQGERYRKAKEELLKEFGG
ncbi:MAG: tetratricopeptide repeat protein [Candidatus Omnitrophota bacterium]|nr:tetratricopeptide repeat protein [Candidatus Omnitrophota bacterium]